MKYLPVLMSGPNPVAIIEGRKVHTRRILNPQPTMPKNPKIAAGVYPDLYNKIPGQYAFWLKDNRMTEPRVWYSPYGVPGDVLWVRETHYRRGYWDWNVAWKDGVKTKEWHFVACDGPVYFPDNMPEKVKMGGEIRHHRARGVWGWWKRPGIFMPRSVARLYLNVKSIRVERLQNISEEDAKKEGIQLEQMEHMGLVYRHPDEKNRNTQQATLAYQWLWESINGPGSWELNPWVWVIGFVKR
jgi:hypothetical protein